MSKKIDEKTLAILSQVTIEGNYVFLTCGQLDRKQYQMVNEVLENLGGKWTKKIKGHIFPEDPHDKIESVLLTGEIIPPKEFGCFFTPSGLAEYIVEMSGAKMGDIALEPSAGQGGLAIPLAKKVGIDKINCCELLPENCKVLLENGFTVLQGDFLSVTPFSTYDIVVMNPPFRVEGMPQADIIHVLHAFSFLKPGGTLISIMSAGVVFRMNKRTVEFRDMVEKYGEMERLEEGSFKESGTGVNTVVVKLRKPNN